MKKEEERNPKRRLLDDIGRILPELKPEIQTLQPPPPGPYGPAALCSWLGSTTWTVFRIAIAIGKRLLQEQLDEYVRGIDRPAGDGVGVPRVCPCAHCGSVVWHYNGLKPRGKRFLSILGEVILPRFQAECSRCGRSFYPLDHILGLSSTLRMLPELQDLVVFLGTRLHFRDAAAALERALGIRLSPQTFHKAIAIVGEAVARRQDLADWEPELQVVKDGIKGTKGPCAVELGLDGAMVPLNEKPKGEPNSHQEARSMSLRVKDKEGNLRAKLIVSRLVPLERFLNSISSLLDECRETLSLTKIILTGDGARWIWQFAERCSISRTVLDWYHLRQYITALSEASRGPASRRRRERIERIKDALWNGRVDEALGELAMYRGRTRQERQARKNLRRYVTNNREHIINYDWNWSRQKTVGSGAIESGQQKAIHDRMKCAGMRWSKTGADRMMAARCAQLNGTATSDVQTANFAA